MITAAQRVTAFRFLLALALAFAVTMALLPQPPELLMPSSGDKVNHMVAFAVLAFLGAHAYPSLPLFRVGERLSFLGALIEVCQAIPSLGRDCDIIDWVADTVAITVVLLLVLAWRSRRETNIG